MFDSLVVQWGTLLGFAALIAVLINILKLAGVVKDDTAHIWSAALNLAGLVALFLAKLFAPHFNHHRNGTQSSFCITDHPTGRSKEFYTRIAKLLYT